jgi:hypothetical protein
MQYTWKTTVIIRVSMYSLMCLMVDGIPAHLDLTAYRAIHPRMPSLIMVRFGIVFLLRVLWCRRG